MISGDLTQRAPAGETATGWSLVVPVKDTARAKSRLAPALGGRRPELALAFARDTVAAALRCAAVSGVTVATDDPAVAEALRSAGATVIGEGNVPELNQVIATAVRTLPETAKVAVVLGDLPALTAAALERALALADRHDTAFVPDAEGTGTTLLTAKRPALLQPSFGAGSASAHASGGAVRLAGWGLSRVRRDVDCISDLVEAARLGVGQHTRALMDEIDLAALEAADLAQASFESLVLEHIGGR